MPATAVRRRFENSLDLVAARPELFVDLVSSPSSTDNAWSMLESPFLGRDVVAAPRTPFEEFDRSPRLLPPAVPVAPLNVKKLRRRGLLSGVHLVLPRTPPPPSPTPRHTPQTSLTFTAEWDSTGRGFLFTPVCDQPAFAISPVSAGSPVPYDIDGETNDIEPASPVAPPSPDSESSRSCASSLFVSRPSTIFNHKRKLSDVSTCPSSLAEDPKPAEPPIVSAAEETIDVLKSDLQRVARLPRVKSFDESCFAGMDDALLLDPWQAFDSLCWTASVDQFPERRSAFPLSPAMPVARPPANVPKDETGSIIDNFQARSSHFSSDDQKLVGAVRTSRYSPLHLHMHFSSISSLKAFKFPRRTRKQH